jgi:hypothetical protein
LHRRIVQRPWSLVRQAADRLIQEGVGVFLSPSLPGVGFVGDFAFRPTEPPVEIEKNRVGELQGREPVGRVSPQAPSKVAAVAGFGIGVKKTGARVVVALPPDSSYGLGSRQSEVLDGRDKIDAPLICNLPPRGQPDLLEVAKRAKPIALGTVPLAGLGQDRVPGHFAFIVTPSACERDGPVACAAGLPVFRVADIGGSLGRASTVIPMHASSMPPRLRAAYVAAVRQQLLYDVQRTPHDHRMAERQDKYRD